VISYPDCYRISKRSICKAYPFAALWHAACINQGVDEKGGRVMRKNIFKQGALALVLTGSFAVGLSASAHAQSRRNRGEAPVEATGNIDRNRNGIDDRYEANGQVDLNQNGIPDNQEGYGRNGRGRGYNGNWNNGQVGNRGYNNADFERGYSDGLSRGRDDALTHRAMTPNNSSHYRSGDAAYRAGFERGFYQAYQQYRGRRW
jgi:hypothetical protein